MGINSMVITYNPQPCPFLPVGKPINQADTLLFPSTYYSWGIIQKATLSYVRLTAQIWYSNGIIPSLIILVIYLLLNHHSITQPALHLPPAPLNANHSGQAVKTNTSQVLVGTFKLSEILWQGHSHPRENGDN